MAYRDEPDVAKDSMTETYVALRLTVDNWRWAGVPIYVRTGKHLPERVTEVALQFHSVPHLAFSGLLSRQLKPNTLALRIQPDEAISLEFGAKVPGEEFRVQSVSMNFCYNQAFPDAGEADGYPRLLHDAMVGDATLFIRTDEVEQAWKVVAPYQEVWAEPGAGMHFYEAGSWGPAMADLLLAAFGQLLASASGMSPDIIPVDDVAASFADVVMDQFAARAGERFALVLSGGPTAAHCYEVLAEEAGGSIDWALVDVYIGDERYVPADDKDSNQKLIRDSLLDRVAPVGSFHPMPTELDIAACASSYATTIGQLLAGPGIDLMHMGLGPDGHTASLFPQAESLQAGNDELVVATEDPNGVNPLPRLTLTLPAINQSRHIVFTVDGASKQQAMAQVRSGADIPVNKVKASDMIWLVDHEAAKAP